MIKADFLVIGSGVAGLLFALKAAARGRVLVVTKANRGESNTKYAQGGIAAVMSHLDTFDSHVNDTLDAGDGLCHEDIVRMVVRQGPRRIQELIDFGTRFDKRSDGTWCLGREGGHSVNRILHRKDFTGQEIEQSLLASIRRHANITVLEYVFVIDLLTCKRMRQLRNRDRADAECFGVVALDIKRKKVVQILSKVTILASGGCGNMYSVTTNPSVATGDGIAMANRAGGRIANMEFTQFHPTALYDPKTRPAFLITEALRGAGAFLCSGLNARGFMERYDSRCDLAPRDIVSRAIECEMKNSGKPHVFLNATQISQTQLLREFPSIYEKCLGNGIDISKQLIPVCPVQHYTCGGVCVDREGQTTIKRLFACGEVASTGLHGANRLASNSLLEGVVYSHNAYLESKRELDRGTSFEDFPSVPSGDLGDAGEWEGNNEWLTEVQELMSRFVGIVRSNQSLERAENRIRHIAREIKQLYERSPISVELCEVRNIVTCALLTIECAKARKESRGLHFTTDYPDKLDIGYDTVR